MNRKKNKQRRKSVQLVPLDAAMNNVQLISPDMSGCSDDLSREERNELTARQEEGFGRHGFRSLIAELE